MGCTLAGCCFGKQWDSSWALSFPGHSPASEAQLSVPSEAVIRTGERTVVIVAESARRFRPVDVKTGTEANGKTVILEGLEDGASVVVSGQFLIDSEANLRGSLSHMSAPAPEKNP